MNTHIDIDSARDSRGFTLVELLVVIAIIGILAGIVLPNVGSYINRSNNTAAIGDIQSINTAITAILSDTERSDFKYFLKSPPTPADVDGGYATEIAQKIYEFENELNERYTDDTTYPPETLLENGDLQDPVDELTGYYTRFFYELLRQGKNAEFAEDLRPEIRQKLANSYLDLGPDPWGEQYQFWMGPMRGQPIQFFRSYRVRETVVDVEDIELDDTDIDFCPYVYDTDARDAENEKVPGAPPEDWTVSTLHNDGDEYEPTGLYGMPAPKDLPVYVYSKGRNLLHDANAILQHEEGLEDYPYFGGGDDVNNWDKEQGWTAAPKG